MATLRPRGQGKGRLGRFGASALIASVTAVATSLPQPASAQSPSGTLSLSSRSGPIGTVVDLTGRVNPGCASSGTVGFELVPYGHASTGGVDTITAAVASDGSFSLHYRIPAVLGGSATRGMYAYRTTPGSYQFQYFGAAGCSPSPAVSFGVTGPAAPATASFAAMVPTPLGTGYWLAQAGGGVYSFGGARFYGSTYSLGLTGLGGARPLAAPIVSMARTPDGKGYWLVGADGGVFGFGDAHFYGSLPSHHIVPFGPIVSMAATLDGKGYWLLGADGGVFSFGDARYSGRGTDWLSPFASMGATLTGYDVAGNGVGQVWQFPGGARISSSSGSMPAVVASISGAANTTDGKGAWQVGLDGGVFAFGSAHYFGSLPGMRIRPAAPIVAVTATPDDRGYWILGSDGGVFSLGDAHFYGSAA